MATYSLKPMPPAVEAMSKLEASIHPIVTSKVFGLIVDPKPNDAQRYDGYGENMYSLVIEETNPRYLLMYQLDEEDHVIVVISISPTFS
jgi:mRNA-degrading endonuclease RelE of RelBE toxin-antitoxin system